MRNVEEDETAFEGVDFDNGFEEYDFPKIAVQIIALKEQIQKIDERIRGRSFALKRAGLAKREDKVRECKAAIRELREQRLLISRNLEMFSQVYPLIDRFAADKWADEDML